MNAFIMMSGAPFPVRSRLDIPLDVGSPHTDDTIPRLYTVTTTPIMLHE